MGHAAGRRVRVDRRAVGRARPGRDRRSSSRAASRSRSTASGSRRSSSCERLHDLGGAHGVGRIDHVEDRLVGIKSREIYETPAATILHAAHRALEGLTLSRDTLRFNRFVADELARLIYDGLWFSALSRDLRGYVASSQRVVSGEVRMRLDHGQAVVAGRTSPLSLYDKSLATYDEGDAFDHASRGRVHRDLRAAAAGRGGPPRRGRAAPRRGLDLDRSAARRRCRRRSPTRSPPRSEDVRVYAMIRA